MKSFKDAKGDTWETVITVSTLKRVNNLLGVDLSEIITQKDGKINCDLLVKLSENPIFLVDVLFAVCKPQCEERKLSDDAFAERLLGDAISDATNALIEGMIDFFPEAKRKMLRKILELGEKISANMNSELDVVLNSPEMEKQISEKIKQFSKLPSVSPVSPG